MKKQLFMLGAALAIVSASQAQNISQDQVPSVIVNKFSTQFPKATDVEWEMDGSFYAVDFEIGWNTDHEIWYNAEGNIIRHIEDIATSELPQAVKDKIKTDFNGYSIDDPERITDNGKVSYKMELNALTQQDWEVMMDAEGNALSKKPD